MRTAAHKLTKSNGDKVTRFGYRTFFRDDRFSPWIWGAGGKWFDGPGKVAIDQAAIGNSFE